MDAEMHSPQEQVISDEQLNLMMEDTATFYLVQQITVGNIRSVTRLREHASFRIGLAKEIDLILKRMTSAGLISINGDRIEVHKKNFKFKLNKRTQARLFPTLFNISTNRAISGIEYGKKGPSIFMISDDPVTAQEIEDALEAFRSTMREIGERVKPRTPEGTRFIGIVNAPMLGQDFLNGDDVSRPESRERAIEHRLQRVQQAAHDIKPTLAAIRALKCQLAEGETSKWEILDMLLARLEKTAGDFLPSHSSIRDFRPAEITTVSDRILCEKRLYWGDSINLVVNLGSPKHVNIAESVLERILSNILDNSYRAMTASPFKQLEVSISESQGFMNLVIRDTGEGFTPGLLADLKERKFRSDTQDGHGLGLKFAFESLEKVGGDITIESGIGAGAKLTLKIPTLHH